MAETPRTGVDHHADLPDGEPERCRGIGVDDLLDRLDLEEVVF